jgi:intermediate peptidase
MVGRTKFQTLAGTRCVTDFVEVPSTLLEEYMRDPLALNELACSGPVKSSLTKEKIALHRHIQRLFWASSQRHTVVLALLDQTLHGTPQTVGGLLHFFTLRRYQI